MISDILIKLKILDDDETLSLTSCALWVVLIKIALNPSENMTDLGSLFVAMTAYQGKKLIKGKQNEDIDFAIKKLSIDSNLAAASLSEIESKISALMLSGAMKQ